MTESSMPHFGLQYTTDGTTWIPVSGWTFTPSYAYNSSSAANVTYTFSGPAFTVLGVRVVGEVHTSNVGRQFVVRPGHRGAGL